MAATWRDFPQDDLERQYNARASVPDFDAEIARYRSLSDLAYATCNVTRDIAYGGAPDEVLDLFPAKDTGAPVFIFLHGGYWRLLGRGDSAMMAPAFTAAGVSVAVVEYSLAPAASLDQIVDQCRRAVAYVARDAARLGIDPARIFVGGSSAGAHLAAMCLAADLPIRGALLASGLFDLEPLRFCVPNDWLKLDGDGALRNSPIHHLPSGSPEVIVTWGGAETDEFKRQSRDYAAALSSHGLSPEVFEVSDRNHFDILCDLAAPERPLFQSVLKMINAGK